ncbi:MAG: TIGR02147 family protein [Myxococcota bacterium]
MADDLPSVFAFLDYRAYLSEWFDAKKVANPKFSHRAFVARTGQRSPSLLSDVIAGRRNLTQAGIEGFQKALSLGSTEARFFRLLVQLDQAETPTEKNAVWVDIMASRRFREARRIEGDSVRYLSNWIHPAIRELANRDSFRDDPAWVARQIRPRITARQARQALDLLFELELLVRHDDGRVSHGGGSVVTPHELAGLAAYNYHQGMLERAKQALSDVQPQERHFLAVTVSAPPSLVPTLKDEFNAFQERILELCANAEPPAGQVFQFNLNFFPLSTPGEDEGGT